MQDCSYPSTLAMVLLQSCTKLHYISGRSNRKDVRYIVFRCVQPYWPWTHCGSHPCSGISLKDRLWKLIEAMPKKFYNDSYQSFSVARCVSVVMPVRKSFFLSHLTRNLVTRVSVKITYHHADIHIAFTHCCSWRRTSWPAFFRFQTITLSNAD